MTDLKMTWYDHHIGEPYGRVEISEEKLKELVSEYVSTRFPNHKIHSIDLTCYEGPFHDSAPVFGDCEVYLRGPKP